MYTGIVYSFVESPVQATFHSVAKVRQNGVMHKEDKQISTRKHNAVV